MTTQRDHFAAWMAYREAAHVALDAAADADLAAHDLRVLLALGVLIGSYGRTADHVGTRQIAAAVYGVEREAVSGWQRAKCGEALRRLAEAGAIAYTTAPGRSARPLIELGPNAPARGRDSELNAPRTGRDTEGETAPDPARNSTRSSAKRTRDRGHSVIGIRDSYPLAGAAPQNGAGEPRPNARAYRDWRANLPHDDPAYRPESEPTE